MMQASLTNLSESSMKVNVGNIDRILRIIVGIALIALAATNTVGVWGYIGVVPLLTGIFKFCPAYTLLGISSCPMQKN
jgi:membrane-bound ClpP family serine protease